MNQAVASQGRRLVEGYQMTMLQFLCLRQLGPLGTTSRDVLASELAVNQATVSGMTDRPEALGYVQPSRSSMDKKKGMIDLTERGMALQSADPCLLREKPARGLHRRAPHWGITIYLVLREHLDMMGEGDDLTEPPLLGGGGSS
jgi:DNA-binding MarR family transcriptional regulator